MREKADRMLSELADLMQELGFPAEYEFGPMFGSRIIIWGDSDDEAFQIECYDMDDELFSFELSDNDASQCMPARIIAAGQAMEQAAKVLIPLGFKFVNCEHSSYEGVQP